MHIMVANHLLFIIALLLCMPTAATLTDDANPPYIFCCPTAAGECSSVDISKYHLYDENPQALEDWNQYMTENAQNCPSIGAFNSESPVTELVMMASPRCHKSYDPRYFTETLRNHKNNYIYRLVIASGNPVFDNYYLTRDNHCTNKLTVIDKHRLTGDYPEGSGSSFTALVTSKMIKQYESDSDADVLVRGEPVGYNDGVIYTVYNTTNGTDFCTQKYVPIPAEYIESEISQYVDGPWLTVEWTGQNHSDGYIVVVGDSCTAQRPCSIIKNTTKVKIKFLTNNLFSTLAKKIRIYNIITTNCTKSEIGYELVHLFKGCRDKCCDDSQYYHDPTLIMKAKIEPSNGTTIATPMSDCNTTEGSISSTTPYPTHTQIKNSMMATNSITLGANLPTAIATTEPSNGTTIVIPNRIIIVTVLVPVVSIVFVLATVVLSLLIVKKRCGVFNSASTSKLSKQLSISHHLKDSSIHPPALEVIVHSSSSQESGKLLGSSGQESHIFTPTSVESTTPLFKDHSGLSQDSHRKDPVVHVLVVYSPSTPEKDQELIRHQFIPELQSYGFKVQSHDFACIKESPSQWLEYEIAMATAVLCICNKEFKNDWENREGGTHSLPLVPSLKHLVHASVQQNECLSKYAIILIDPTDKSYIPTKYLQADPRQFSVDNVEDIVRFVRGIPSHSMSLPSSE